MSFMNHFHPRKWRFWQNIQNNMSTHSCSSNTGPWKLILVIFQYIYRYLNELRLAKHCLKINNLSNHTELLKFKLHKFCNTNNGGVKSFSLCLTSRIMYGIFNNERFISVIKSYHHQKGKCRLMSNQKYLLDEYDWHWWCEIVRASLRLRVL